MGVLKHPEHPPGYAPALREGDLVNDDTTRLGLGNSLDMSESDAAH